MNNHSKPLSRPVQCLYGIALERDEIKFKAISDTKSICCVPFDSKEHYTCMLDDELLTATIEGKQYLIIATLSSGGMIS